MKHFEFKNTFRGAGFGGGDPPKPKPAFLVPPELGAYSVLSSFSYLEVVDLVCDGPIKGLVNQNGYPLPPEYLLQGVYLDGIPVEESQENFLVPFDELVAGGENGQINESQQPALVSGVKEVFDSVAALVVTTNDGVVASQSSSAAPSYYQVDDYVIGSPRLLASPITAVAVFGISYNGSIIELVRDGSNLVWENNYAGTSAESFVDAHQVRLNYELETDLRPGFWKLVATSDKYNGTGWYKDRVFNASTQEFEDAPYGNPTDPFNTYTGYPADNLPGIVVDGQGGGYIVDSSLDRDVNAFYTRTEDLGVYQDTLNGADPQTGRPIYDIDIEVNANSKYQVNFGMSVNTISEMFDSQGSLSRGADEILNITPSQSAEYTYLTERLKDYGFDLTTQTLDTAAIKDIVRGNYDPSFTDWFTDAESNNRVGPYLCIKVSGQLEAYLNQAQTDLFQNQAGTAVNTDARLILDSVRNSTLGEISSRTINLLVPEMANDGSWNGNVKGFYLVELGFFRQLRTSLPGITSPYSDLFIGKISKKDIQFFVTNKGFKVYSVEKAEIDPDDNFVQLPSKFNYSNILCEFRNGLQSQDSLDYFKKLFVDFTYDGQLWGPFRQSGQVEKIRQGAKMLSPQGQFNLSTSAILGRGEGSNDDRSTREGRESFDDWNDKAPNFEESAQPLTHIIYNNNVDEVFITLRVDALSDTVQQDIGDPEDPTFRAGARIPGTMNFKVEVGYVNSLGDFETTLDIAYKISSIVESPALLDIGNPDNRSAIDDFDFLREINRDEKADSSCQGSDFDLFDPFPLPPAHTPADPNDTSRSEDVKTKRFIRVTRLSTETSSILVQKKMTLLKVTEIMPLRMEYPYSAIAGMKIDSRSFESPPTRTYDCKLKMIRVPSNYFPTDKNDKDLRYWDQKNEIDNLSQEKLRIYKGDWDGTFKYEWTDNPAWILYDMIVSTRYGLGEHLREEQVNKWDLYKIGRFCDSVNKDGVYEGVDDGRGGLEPRFACNIMFSQGTRIFDSINTIASIFRGFVYYQNSEISFSDDRFKDPIAVFTNSMVEEGVFSYSNLKRDEKFNAIEVPYIDKYDGFKTKVEYVEDEEDVSRRGTFKKTVNGFGITSKSQANRLARHVLFQGTKEDQAVGFVVGLESLLVSPGDLIIIEDDLKSLDSNFGRILEIDTENYTIRTSQPFVSGDYEDYITMYVPVAKQNIQDVSDLTSLVRSRTYGFEILSTSNNTFNSNFVGDYSFERYTEGFSDLNVGSEPQNEYGLYKGGPNNESFVWFSTGATGWVFSTGSPLSDNNIYDKYIVQGDTFSFSEITNPNPGTESESDIMTYDTAQADRRASFVFNGQGLFRDSVEGDLDYTQGISEADIDITSATQVYDFKVTGTNAKEFGDLVYLDQNDPTLSLLSFVPLGTSYRFKNKNREDQIYKIVGTREESDNKYTVEAVKFLSDRYDQIEKPSSVEDPFDNFGYYQDQFNVSAVSYIKIEEPTVTLSQGYSQGVYDNFISASWTSSVGATSYNVEFVLPNGQRISKLGLLSTSCVLDDLYSIGKYKCRVEAKGLPFDNQNFNTRYYDSEIGEENIQVIDLQNQSNQGDPSLISEMDIIEL